jgi:transcriptional repressor NrdR
LRCPYCKANNDRVIDSRTSGEADAIRRRRECLDCKGRFTTYETAGETPLRVVKKDGSREPFDREKLLRSLQVACQKRPIGTEVLENVAADLESRLHEMFEKEVASKYIGHLVMEALRELDQVAYVRFASVYREFKDVNQFLDELKPLLDRGAADRDAAAPPTPPASSATPRPREGAAADTPRPAGSPHGATQP